LLIVFLSRELSNRSLYGCGAASEATSRPT
jgi:hypothetical protein